MASQIGSQSQQDDKGFSKEIGGYPHVFYCHHDVIFLESLRLPGDLVEFPQILLGGLQFYHHQLRLRGGSGEVLLRNGVSRGDSG